MSDELRAQILTAVREAAVEVLDCDADEVTPDANLSETLDADSIDVIEIASTLERQFGVAIEDHEVYDLSTVGELVELVAGKKE
ncbi:MAG TPA: acyl carrier protein [Iamia sp.]|jgi:acyl carrier protein|nr:acyl carrier protein [Iamia sp.]HMJ78243.1 acyl carrier protein [Iamia sp.]